MSRVRGGVALQTSPASVSCCFANGPSTFISRLAGAERTVGAGGPRPGCPEAAFL